MTDETMAVKALLGKALDADFLRKALASILRKCSRGKHAEIIEFAVITMPKLLYQPFLKCIKFQHIKDKSRVC